MNLELQLKNALKSNSIDNIHNVFSKIYSFYGRLVYFTIMKYVDNQSDIEELTQEVFVDFFNNLDNKIYNIKYYLLTSAKNKAIDYLKSKKHNIEYTDLSQFRNFEDDSISKNYENLLSAFKNYLSDLEIDILIQHIINDLTFKELSKSKFTSFINIKIDYKVDYEDIKCKIDARKYVKVKEKNNIFTKIKENKRYRVTAISVLASLLCAGIVMPYVINENIDYQIPSELPSTTDGVSIPPNPSLLPSTTDGVSIPPNPSLLPSIYKLYPIGNQISPSSFANLKLLEIDESYYVKEGTDYKYIYVKFEVVEDFYQVLPEKEIVSILFDVNLGLTPSSKKYFEKAELDNWLLSQDSFCVSFRGSEKLRYKYICFVCLYNIFVST